MFRAKASIFSNLQLFAVSLAKICFNKTELLPKLSGFHSVHHSYLKNLENIKLYQNPMKSGRGKRLDDIVLTRKAQNKKMSECNIFNCVCYL